ncbi:MAG TPA: hypothetical protein VF035_08645 [Longimicrobiales bacterium]
MKRDARSERVWFRKRADAPPPEGGHWLVKAVSRMRDARDGQTIEYPARLAVCPRGHVRSIPTRFDRPVTALRCTACNRSYDINAS